MHFNHPGCCFQFGHRRAELLTSLVWALAFGAMAAAPVNDSFFERLHLRGVNLTVHGRTIGATAEANEPNHAGVSGGHSVWYSWRAPANGLLEIRLENIDSPPVPTLVPLVAVYSWNYLSGLVPLVDNNNSNTNLGPEFGPTFGFAALSVRAGRTYHIALDAKTGSPAQKFKLSLNLLRAPRNDDFAARFRIYGASLSVEHGSTVYATRQPGEPVVFGEGASVWWTWIAPADGTVVLSATGGCPGEPCSPVVSVFTGRLFTNLTLVATNKVVPPCPVPPDPRVVCRDVGMEPDVFFKAVRGRAYHIRAEAPPVGPIDTGRVILDLELDSFHLISPTNSAVFPAGSNILMRLARLSPVFDGVFKQVDFFIDAETKTIKGPPFVYTWTNPPPGVHYISAAATNRAGRLRVAPTIAVTVTSTNAP